MNRKRPRLLGVMAGLCLLAGFGVKAASEAFSATRSSGPQAGARAAPASLARAGQVTVHWATLRTPAPQNSGALQLTRAFGTFSAAGRFTPQPSAKGASIRLGAATFVRLRLHNPGPRTLTGITLSEQPGTPGPVHAPQITQVPPGVSVKPNGQGGFSARGLTLDAGQTVELVYRLQPGDSGEYCAVARATAPRNTVSAQNIVAAQNTVAARACLTVREFRPDGHVYIAESRDADPSTPIEKNRNYSVIGGFEVNLGETYDTVVYVENRWQPWRSNASGVNVPIFGQLPLSPGGRFTGQGFEVESVRYALIDQRTEPGVTVASGEVKVDAGGRFGLRRTLPREHVLTLTARIRYTKPGRYCTFGPFLNGQGYPNTIQYPKQHCALARATGER